MSARTLGHVWRREGTAHLDLPSPHKAKVMIKAEHIPAAGHHNHHLRQHQNSSCDVITDSWSICSSSRCLLHGALCRQGLPRQGCMRAGRLLPWHKLQPQRALLTNIETRIVREQHACFRGASTSSSWRASRYPVARATALCPVGSWLGPSGSSDTSASSAALA